MNTIGPYELLGKVAQSTSSTVWKAHDPLLDRDVALKQVDRTGNPAALHQEATVLAALDHPNIVRVIDIISIDDTTWLVEEWVDGATLAAVRDHSGRLSTAQAVGTVRGALQGLAYAHDRGIVHGDIAPGNILVDLTGVSKLVDFGAGHGTTGYQSPEVAAGQPAGKPSDVYSAAAVLADLLSDTQPAAGTPRPTPTPVTISGPIGQVLDKALAPTPTPGTPTPSPCSPTSTTPPNAPSDPAGSPSPASPDSPPPPSAAPPSPSPKPAGPPAPSSPAPPPPRRPPPHCPPSSPPPRSNP